MEKQQWKCDQCDRSFMMAAHLGRHKATMHGQKGAKRVNGKTRRTGPGEYVAGRTGKVGDVVALPIESLIMLRRRIDQELADRVVRGTV